MSRISLTDYAFLLTETEDSPRHVAGIQIYEPPKDYPGDFVADLHQELLTRPAHAPFDRRVRISATRGPQWTRDPNFDLEYHVRRSALPAPGSRAQLGDLTSRLHSFLLDRDRPLWELHIIEGLEGGRFALYTKIHHAYCDGATLTRMLSGTLNTDPTDLTLKAYWEAPDEETPRHSPPRGLLRSLSDTAGGVRKGIGTGIELSKLFTRMGMEKFGLAHGGLEVPFTAPRTLLNGELTRARRVAGTRIELDRIKAVAHATESTVNDVVVTVADSALRRYLDSQGEQVAEPLVAQLPVNLRSKSDTSISNVVGILPVRLAGGSPNPVRRLRQISRSTNELKGSLSGLSQGAVITYTLLIQGASQLGELLGLNDYIPPLGNILISNLAGPRQPLYLRGARMLEIYPISTIPPGMAMNITVFSYDGHMFFGMIAGYDAIPGLNDLRSMIADAMADLEAAVSQIGKPARRKPAPPRKTGAKKRRAPSAPAQHGEDPTPAQIAARAAARRKMEKRGKNGKVVSAVPADHGASARGTGAEPPASSPTGTRTSGAARQPAAKKAVRTKSAAGKAGAAAAASKKKKAAQKAGAGSSSRKKAPRKAGTSNKASRKKTGAGRAKPGSAASKKKTATRKKASSTRATSKKTTRSARQARA